VTDPRRGATKKLRRQRRMPMDWGLARDYAARDVHAEEKPVTEAEWLAATDPVAVLQFLRQRAQVNARQLRLVGCACARLIWKSLGEEPPSAIEVAEGFAEGAVTQGRTAESQAGGPGKALPFAYHRWLAATTVCSALAGRSRCFRKRFWRGGRRDEAQRTADRGEGVGRGL
jgi:hypothetical protein